MTTASAESAACEESTSVIDPDEEEEREDEDRAVVLENLAQWIFESVEGNLVDQSQWCRNIDLTENDESEFSQRVALLRIETADEHSHHINDVDEEHPMRSEV